jgi:predicted amidohydrolase YtcJ
VVLLRSCGHAAVASTAALALAHAAVAADPPGGRIERDAAGRPTGVLLETAVDLVLRRVPDPDERERRAALAAALREALSFGVTTVHSMDAWAVGEIDAVEERYRAVRREDGVATRACLLWPADDTDRLAAAGRRTGSGDRWLRLGPAKLFADGSLGARTAALFEPYADAPGSRGRLRYTPEELEDRVWRAHAAGNQVAVHAIGDRAAEVALRAIEAAQRRMARTAPRHRLIHLQLLRPETLAALARGAAAGTLVADVQPVFAASDAPWVGRALGLPRLTGSCSYPLASLLGAGVAVSAGSDAPVEPQNPWLGVRAALRPVEAGTPDRDRAAEGWWRREAVDLETALRVHTAGGAYAEFAEGWKGVLRAGAAADLVVLDRGPDGLEPSSLAGVRSSWTLVGGETAHGGP